jgi:Mg-chelatase subunit ChlD
LGAAVLLAGCSAGTVPNGQRASAANGGGGPRPASGSVASAGHGDIDNPTSPVAGAAAQPPSAPGDADAGDECGRQRFDVKRRPADILLVLDRSGSMKDEIDSDDDNSPSKWDVVVPALNEVVQATNGAVSWGLKLFPKGDDAGECKQASYPDDIAVPVAAMNADKVNAAIAASMPKGDGTPTSDAVNEGTKYLKSLADDNRKYILLATDGEPSCDGTTKSSSQARTAAVTAVQNAAMAGFNTFVVGIATTKKSASETLSDLGKAGGEAPSDGYYLATTKDQLVSALEMIAGEVASCHFPLGMQPPDPNHVGVLLGSDVIHKDTGHKNGWDYADDQHSAIDLYGAACDAVKASAADSVNIVFGCKDDVLF